MALVSNSSRGALPTEVDNRVLAGVSGQWAPAQITAAMLAAAATIGTDGWIDDSAETWTQASATTFTVPTDLTAKYTKGTRLKLTQSGTTKYFVVVASSFGGGNTTVTVTAGSDNTLAAVAISANYHSYVANPQGYPGWFNYAPATTGVTSDATVAQFSVVGNACTVVYLGSATSNATTKTFALPIPIGVSFNFEAIAAGFSRDNGTTPTAPSRIGLPTAAGGSTVTLTKDLAGTAWTGSGSWACIGTFTYQI